MTDNSNIEALTVVVNALTPLDSLDRVRVIDAALALLGEKKSSREIVDSDPKLNGQDVLSDGTDSVVRTPKAKAWMRQFSISEPELENVFHFNGEGGEFISPTLPGKSKKDQTYNAYVMAGISQLLHTGNTNFDDKLARVICEKVGCYDQANHATHIKNRGNEFAGDKDKGWNLTGPGLKLGAALIKEINKIHD